MYALKTLKTANEIKVWNEIAQQANLAHPDVFFNIAKKGKTPTDGIAYLFKYNTENIGSILIQQSVYDQKNSISFFAVAITHKLRGKGHGRALLTCTLKEIKDAFPHIEQVRLFTSTAADFYLKLEFESFGILKTDGRNYHYLYKNL